MSVAFLFPGQGAQHDGMLHRLPVHSAVTSTLDEASQVLGQDVLLLDSEEALRSTATVQLALLIAGVAVARALAAEGAMPELVAGLSVGAFGAAVAAGHLDFAAALRLVRLRGELMESLYPQGYGMGAILGLNEIQVNSLLKDSNTPATPVFLANVNAPRQIVVSGSEEGVWQVLELAQQAGARKTELLAVPTPSHSPLMKQVAEQLAQEMAAIAIAPSPITYVSSSTARALRRPDAVKDDLAQNVARPVRWYDATTALYEFGARLFIELPPGRVLTDLASEAFPEARSLALADSSLSSALTLMQRETS